MRIAGHFFRFYYDLNDDVLKQLIEFSEDWAAENSCYGYRANDRSDIEGNRIFFAEEDGCVVGYLFGNLYTTESRQADMPKGAPYFEVEELYVVPDKRSRGIQCREERKSADTK